jgi:hypothetical protein
MGQYAECHGCHRYGFTEIHHIVERSHAPYMRNVKLNFINLCPTCHRTGKYAVHKDRKVDLKYKQELQLKLQQLFNKDYYKVHQIKDMLGISKREAESLCRHLKIYKEGYKSKDLIFHMMGDKNYLGWEED